VSNTFNDLSMGKRVSWSELDEQGRYEAWSFYAHHTHAPFAYVPFCNHMDVKTSAEQFTGPRRIINGLAHGVSTFGQGLADSSA
jgi:hypothetical protein